MLLSGIRTDLLLGVLRFQGFQDESVYTGTENILPGLNTSFVSGDRHWMQWS